MKIIKGKKVRVRFGVYVLVPIVLLLVPGCGSKEETTPEVRFTPKVTVAVKYVIDGDTLVTEDGEHIRFLGIDSPEIWKKKGDKRDEPWGRDAANFVKVLLLSGSEVGLAFEAGAAEGPGPRHGNLGRKGEGRDSTLSTNRYVFFDLLLVRYYNPPHLFPMSSLEFV